MKVGSDETQVRVSSEQTGGALLALEVQMGPGGGPPGLHRHAPEEVYRVDRGQLTISLEDGHNESRADASAYVVFTPGTQMEQFLRAADRIAGSGSPRMEEMIALAQRHGIEMAP